jgi:hypothetical protein
MKQTQGLDDIDREAERVFGNTRKSRRVQTRDGLKNVHPEFDDLFIEVKHGIDRTNP